MLMFFTTLLSCSVTMSIISLVYTAAIPLLSKKYSAKWLYYIWLIVLIGWVFPFRPSLNIDIRHFHIPDMKAVQSNYMLIDHKLNTIGNGAKENFSIPIWYIAVCIWAVGVIGMLLFNAWRHYCFIKMIRRWSEEITDPKILLILDDLKAEMKVKKHVRLKTCISITSPMMIGLFSPTILLPSGNMSYSELKLILRHELIHLKRNDIWYKALALLAAAIHWFNPVVYLVTKVIAVQCEISCDELLIMETDFEQRRQYGETLIGAVRTGAKIHTALSADFYSQGKSIKTRVRLIMDTTKKRAGIIILCFIFLAVAGSGIAYASNLKYNSDNTQIIKVNVKKLQPQNIIDFKGPYELEAGDIVQYNISTSNNSNLYVEILQIDSLKFGTSIFSQYPYGYILAYPSRTAIINAKGKYCIFVKFRDLQGASDIKGTIEIMKGKGKK